MQHDLGIVLLQSSYRNDFGKEEGSFIAHLTETRSVWLAAARDRFPFFDKDPFLDPCLEHNIMD
jgi:hypothetical protein